MSRVIIRNLRNHGGDVVDRVFQGEHITVTRAGKPVAELRPGPFQPLTAEALLERWQRLPPIDPEALRRDLDSVIDPHL